MFTSMPTASARPPSLSGFAPRLWSSARALSKPSGATLFRQGTRPAWMYFVLNGEAVMVRHGIEGDEVILQRARTSFIAEASLTSARYHCDAICRTDCDLLAFPVGLLREFIDGHAGTRWTWIELLGREARRQRAGIERLHLKTVKARLLHLLAAESDNGHYPLPGTRQQLARELGVTPEALYRTLASLQREHVIAVADKGITCFQLRDCSSRSTPKSI